MKLSILIATALLTATGAANAYEDFQSFSGYPNTPWVRGTINNWGKTALVAGTYTRYTGVNYIAYVNVLGGAQQFKFDTSANGDWSANYGDGSPSYGDYSSNFTCLVRNGANIPFVQGSGTYEVRYLAGAQDYICSRYQITKLNSFVANVRSLYLRTSFNGWKPLPMFLAKDHVWEAEVSGAPNTSGAMKFDQFGDWSSNFGRTAASDIRSYTNTGYAVAINGANLGLYMEDYSGAATVKVKIRFNDQTNEFALCRDTTRPICQ